MSALVIVLAVVALLVSFGLAVLVGKIIAAGEREAEKWRIQ